MKFSVGLLLPVVGLLGIAIVIISVQTYEDNTSLRTFGNILSFQNGVQDIVYMNESETSNITGELKHRFPDIIIIGAKKSGTSVLLRMLSQHPLIKIAEKEIFYFSDPDRYQRGISWYIAQMPLTKKGELTLEKSPHYFASRVTPERLKLASTDVKLLLIVRNPLYRTISNYFFLQKIRKGKIDKTLSTFRERFFDGNKINTNCEEIQISLYDDNYSQWLKWFSKEQILIVNGDYLKVNPQRELTKIESFLNIPHYLGNKKIKNVGRKYYFKNSQSELNYVGYQHNWPEVSKHGIKKLAKFLQPHARRFCQMASVNYTWCTDIYT